ncbi:MAG TPA: hypothetical protein VEY87_09305 [Gaiellaceae bacterium]|nr:hypothetical protein [Gaiellaceae bacterium]
MTELAAQPPWFVAGQLLGASVVLMYLVANARLVVVGGFSDVVERASEWSMRLGSGVLVAAGVLIGFGAKTAGGCTSGNGLCGNAIASPAGAVATATFFGVAVVVTLVTAALFGSGA